MEISNKHLQQVDNWFKSCCTGLTEDQPKEVQLKSIDEARNSLHGQLIVLCVIKHLLTEASAEEHHTNTVA